MRSKYRKGFDLTQYGDGLQTIFLSLTLGKDQKLVKTKTRKILIYWNGKFPLERPRFGRNSNTKLTRIN